MPGNLSTTIDGSEEDQRFSPSGTKRTRNSKASMSNPHQGVGFASRTGSSVKGV